MSPANTETLFALGVGERVVGVSDYSDYPEEAKNKPSIGRYDAPDLEKIVSLAPDLVFAEGESQAKYIRILEQAGIRVISVSPHSLPDVLAAIDVISEAIGEQERGVALHQELAGKLATVQRAVALSQRQRVFLQVWDAPLLTVGAKSFINDMISQAGGLNVAAVKNVDYTPCDIETLYAFDPEFYIAISHSRQDINYFIDRPELADIRAVKNKKVFGIMDDLVGRPGPRCFSGLVQLAQILHPEEMHSRHEE